MPKTTGATTKTRVPNVERSARTRQRLLDATIDCLYRLGYHETSTNTVIRQAGVSRGAMLHQFPTKADLMIAVQQHIAQLRGNAHRAGLEHVADDRERYIKLIDILWSEMKTPSGVARIEIMLGSRSDPDFAARFTELNQRLEHLHKEGVWVLAQRLGFTDRKLVDDLVQLYAASLRGLAIDALQPHAGPEVEGAVELLKRYQLMLLDQQKPA